MEPISETSGEEAGDFWHRSASLLLGLPADLAIRRLLGTLGRAHRADRAWMMRYNRAFTHFWNTYEWTRGGASAHVDELQGIPVEMGAWLHESLLEDRPVYIADTRRMPRRARALQAEFRRQGIRSLLSVPVFYRGRLAFQIGYDATRETQQWSEEEIAVLRRMGRLFALRLLTQASPTAFEEEVEETEIQAVRLQETAGHRKVLLERVTHLVAQGDYSRVHFADAPDLSGSRSLRHWESILPPQQFVRVSRSVIVNLGFVERLDRRGGSWKLELQGVEEPVAVGRPYRAALRQRVEF